MNREQKINYLKKYRQAAWRIKSIELDLEELESRIHNISPKISPAKVQTSPEPDKITALLAKKEKMESRLLEQQAEALEEMAKVMAVIDTAKNPLHHAILTRHYISGASLDDISLELNYEYSWITRLHKRAIDSLKI